MDWQYETEVNESTESNQSVRYDRYGFCGGKEFTDPSSETRLPLKVIRAREMKWREMCNNWEHWMKHNRSKVLERCRKGIPDSMRCEAWQRLCNSPMVLVARPKVFAATPDSAQKPNTRKSLFGTLGNRNASKSLPTVITTSPSFRIKRGKDKDQRQYLLKKLYGDKSNLPPTPAFHEASHLGYAASQPRSGYSSLVKPTHSKSVNADSDVRRFNYSVPVCTTYDWPHPNGDSSETASHPVGVGLLSNDSGVVVSSCSNEFVSAFTTTASVHYSTAVAPCFTAVPPTAATSGSGGYASLSTNSATDSASIRNLVAESHDRHSTDSCASSLRLSSFDSSSSILWPQNQSAEVEGGQQDLIEIQDTRATLVPALDPDPVTLYEQYCMQEGVPANCDQIRRDIDRQFPFHELFNQKDGHGQESLYTLLKAYTVRHSDKGYCQGQAPLAAVLLMFMPEVDAFWTFNEVCERYLVAYYDDGLERIQIDAEILYALLKNIYPAVYKHLKKNGVDALLIAVEWFMCVFTRTLPWESVLRVLDMFFCEGKVVLFRVGIVLLHRLFGTRALRKAHNSMEDIMMRLRDVQSVVPNSSEFVRETLRLELSPRDVAQEAIRQSHKWDRKKKLQMKQDIAMA